MFHKEPTLIIQENGNTLGIINPSALIGVDQNDEYYLRGLNGTYKIPDIRNKDLTTSLLLASGSVLTGTELECSELLNILKDPVKSRTAAYICNFCTKANDVVSYFTKTKQYTISIIGCGGIGSISTVIMAGMGFKNFKIFDFDVIESSNLNRQFFYTKDTIGKYKSEVLKEELHKRYDNLNIESNHNKLTSQGLKEETAYSDIVIFTADEPIGVINDYLQDLSSSEKVPQLILHAGYNMNLAGVLIMQPKKSTGDQIKWTKLKKGISPSFGPLNIELAGIITSLVTEYLLNGMDNFEMLNDNNILWNSLSFPRVYNKF